MYVLVPEIVIVVMRCRNEEGSDVGNLVAVENCCPEVSLVSGEAGKLEGWRSGIVVVTAFKFVE